MTEGKGWRPDAGDLVWTDFGAPVGHEQAGRRPSLVLTSHAYHQRSSLVILCPVTRNDRPWPFKIRIPLVGGIEGHVLLDQIRSVDAAHRIFGRIGRVPDQIMSEIRQRLSELLLP